MVDFIQPKNPKSQKIAEAVLESIETDDIEMYKRHVAHALEWMVELRKIDLAAQSILARALETKDTVALLSMQVKASEMMMDLLSKGDEQLEKQFRAHTSSYVDRMLRRYAPDAFVQNVETGNQFQEMDIKRAIAQQLREIADGLIEECKAGMASGHGKAPGEALKTGL